MLLRRSAFLLSLAMLCGAAAGLAQEIFVLELDGATVVPPNASPGTGSGTLLYTSGTHTLDVDLAFSSLSASATSSHIHCCMPPPTGAIVAVSFNGFPPATAGHYVSVLALANSLTYSAAFLTAHGGTAPSAEAALLNGLRNGNAYVDIHTSMYPGGEIRAYPLPVIFRSGFEGNDFSGWSSVQ